MEITPVLANMLIAGCIKLDSILENVPHRVPGGVIVTLEIVSTRYPYD